MVWVRNSNIQKGRVSKKEAWRIDLNAESEEEKRGGQEREKERGEEGGAGNGG